MRACARAQARRRAESFAAYTREVCSPLLQLNVLPTDLLAGVGRWQAGANADAPVSPCADAEGPRRVVLVPPDGSSSLVDGLSEPPLYHPPPPSFAIALLLSGVDKQDVLLETRTYLER